MRIYIYCLSIVFLTSCLKQEESIEPFVEAKNLSQLQREMFIELANGAMDDNLSIHQPKYAYDASKQDVFFLRLNYNFLNIDINTPSEGEGNFEILANKFVMFFAKVFFKMGGTYNIELENIDINIPELNIDRSIISAIYIDKVKLQYSNRIRHQYGPQANFRFINNFEITIPYLIPETTNEIDLLLFGYDQTNNQCSDYCINLDIFTYDILDFVGRSTSLKLQPTLTVQEIPIKEMEFSGNIEIVIELKLPF